MRFPWALAAARVVGTGFWGRDERRPAKARSSETGVLDARSADRPSRSDAIHGRREFHRDDTDFRT